MKKQIFFLLLGAISLIATAQKKETKEPHLSKTLASDAIRQVEVETSGGSIYVIGGATSDARIEVYVTKNYRRSGDEALSKAEIQKRLDAECESKNINQGKNLMLDEVSESGFKIIL